MTWLYAVTLFTSALLLFWIQPLIAKMILPLLGGTPGVWNASMVFFQTVLLAGYLYAHLLSRKLSLKWQAVLHSCFLLAALLFMPVKVGAGHVPPASAHPFSWVFALLALSVGLPAFVISGTAPLLQHWFTRTGHREAGDPYFLYGANNLGSMAALLAYPAVIEPALTLSRQSRTWTAVYLLLVLLLASCAAAALRGLGVDRAGDPEAGKPARNGEAAPAAVLRARWLLLSFAPSSLLLGVTTHITTDIAAVPLFWVVPLAIYLLTFILVFSRKRPLPHRWALAAQPFVVLPLAYLFATGKEAEPATFPLHLLALFSVALVCHGELADSRPPAGHLTEFYLWMSVGGVLGGLFNALLAPLLFKGVWEYPLILVMACALRPLAAKEPTGPWAPRLDLALPAGLFLGAAGALLILKQAAPFAVFLLGWKIVLVLAAAAVWFMRARPARFALGTCALIAAGLVVMIRPGEVLFRERNFFGVITVTENQGKFHVFNHGRAVHGAQSLDPGERREALTYFSRPGPLGQVFANSTGPHARNRIAVIGLGAGSVASYGQRGQRITFYEIDPSVERVARDPRLFTFLSDSPAEVDVVIGDARLTLARTPDASFDMIIIDAFSSDSVPVHIITREALTMYAAKLAPGGIMVFNISNRYLTLEPVLGNIAAEMGLFAMSQYDSQPTFLDEIQSMRSRSLWVVIARQMEDVGWLPMSGPWDDARVDSTRRVWTDDYSNILSVLSP